MGRRKKYQYILPKAIYMETLWFIRDYPSMKFRAEEVLGASSGPADGQPRGNGIGDPTAAKADSYSSVAESIRIIDKALSEIPVEYQRHIFSNIIDRSPYPPTANRKTYAKYRRQFIWWTAYYRGRIV